MSSDSPRTAAGRWLWDVSLGEHGPQPSEIRAAILAIEDEARRDGMKVADATPELAGFGHDGEASLAASGDAPHPIMAKYGLESMKGDPLVILERHLVNNHAATLGGKDLLIERLQQRLAASPPLPEGLDAPHVCTVCGNLHTVHFDESDQQTASREGPE